MVAGGLNLRAALAFHDCIGWHRGYGVGRVNKDRFTTSDKRIKKNLSFVKNISERLAHAIRHSGHTKGALAAHIGVPQPSVSRWLKGSEPRIDRLFEIAKFLNVDVKWLMTGEGQFSPYTESSTNPKDSGLGESACVLREEPVIYGSQKTTSADDDLVLAFRKIREGLDLLERIMKKG